MGFLYVIRVIGIVKKDDSPIRDNVFFFLTGSYRAGRLTTCRHNSTEVKRSLLLRHLLFSVA